MKALAFSLDALFALLITASGVTVMLYFVYNTITPSAIQYSSSSNFVAQLASEKLSSLVGVPIALTMSNQSMASGQSWPERLADSFNSGGNQYGPSVYSVEYTVNVPVAIVNGTLVANYGNVYFGAGQTIYAINATTGSTVWTSSSVGTINSTAIYDGMLIYSTGDNAIALNAFNGATLWSANTFVPASGTPNGDEFTMFSLIYGGKLIGGTYDPDGTGPASTYNSIYAYFVNNGTYAGGVHSIVSHPPGQALKVPYVAIASGQIAAGILEDGSPKYEALVTGVSNVSTGTGILWQATLPGSSQISDTAAYGNTLAVANGATGYVETVATGSGSGSWPLQGSSGTGVSSYNGRYAFQGTGGVTAISQSGTAQLWSVAAPAQYGTTGLTNATPIQTPNNIYTIWPNRYVAEENQSSGAFTNYAAVPYPGTINPIMILAYGKLFASFGNKLVVFGTCQANSNSSILSTLATLYLNNEGSCADYLLYSLHGIGNSSMSLNSKPVITKAYLNGVPGSNIIIPYESQLGINGPFTVSLWFNSNKPSTTTFTSELFDTKTASQDTFDIALIGRGANPGIQIDAGAGGSSWLAQPFIPLAFQQNRWYNVVVTVGTTSTSVYLNGANVSTTSYSSAAPLLVADNLPIQLGSGGADPFYGSLSNVQIYSNTILQNQISQLYSAGLNGGPTSQSNIVDWFPLAGDANGYGPIMAPGFPSAVVYNDTVYNATGLVNSFSVSSQLVQAPLQNYSTGRYNLYNISVYSWR